MERRWMSVAILAACVGCQSPNGWGVTGTRVPPPATGSYGPPNTYYQSGFPASQGTPAGTGVQLAPSSQWRTARDDRDLAAAETGEAASGANSSIRVTDAKSDERQVVSTTLAPAASQLKPMPINEARSLREPGLFTPDESASELKTAARSSGSGDVQPASAVQRGTATKHTASSATWQTRDGSSP